MQKQRSKILIVAMLVTMLSTVQANEYGIINDATPAKHEAIASLLNKAADHLEQHALDAASALLERALRIDSQDAEIWQLLSQLRLLQGEKNQAEAMAAKAGVLRDRKMPVLASTEQTVADHKAAQQALAIDMTPVPAQLPEQNIDIPQANVATQTSTQNDALLDRKNSLATTLREHDHWVNRKKRLQLTEIAQSLQIKQLIHQLQEASVKHERLYGM